VKTVALEKTNLQACVDQAQRGRVLVTKGGAPIAVLVGVAGLDREQIALGSSSEFWNLIALRRKEPMISRAELERRLRSKTKRRESK